MRKAVDLEGDAYLLLTGLQQRLAGHHPRVVDEDGHFADLLAYLGRHFVDSVAVCYVASVDRLFVQHFEIPTTYSVCPTKTVFLFYPTAKKGNLMFFARILYVC